MNTKAIRYHQYGPPEVMVLETIEAPALTSGQVRVSLCAAGVAPLDTKLRAGLLERHVPLRLPKIPGRDGAGVIVESSAEGLHVGDAVCVIADMFGQGTYADSIVLPAARVVAQPASLTKRQAAALLQPGASAWIPMVRTAQVSSGMKILVHAGSGAVGSLMIQLAVHLGAEVWATCSSANRDAVLALGATGVIAHDKEDFSTLRGFDVVFDLVGADTHDRSYPVLKPGGQLVWLVAAPIRERGDEFKVRVIRSIIDDDPECLRQVALLAQQQVLVPAVGQCFPLAEAAFAHALLESGKAPRGRIVLDIA
ncbi:NADP-dependent oxidoreductase [Herbaspirillum sp. C9C3]|uniref:NADP-dependent oxidoreductase n=1 Tax=Herbaspirillum sp. C9C3 TaxID=2735271 RepID=UPI0015853E92|nr:NADP-dependent oxidoreductase [Herbaspirillum sp. C9C3]NUT61904.1 NADP-dependent oxidoreductase [Herbaspirillum sp. C9C3]